MDFKECCLIIKEEVLERLNNQYPNSPFKTQILECCDRIYCHLDTIKDLNSITNYQSILSAMRGLLECYIDIEYILRDPNCVKQIADWEFCIKAKPGNKVLEFYKHDKSKIPSQFKYSVEYADGYRQKIQSLKLQYGWKKTPDAWYNKTLYEAVLDINDPIYIKEYLHLSSVYGWGTHGSGNVIQHHFSTSTYQSLFKDGRGLCFSHSMMIFQKNARSSKNWILVQ